MDTPMQPNSGNSSNSQQGGSSGRKWNTLLTYMVQTWWGGRGGTGTEFKFGAALNFSTPFGADLWADLLNCLSKESDASWMFVTSMDGTELLPSLTEASQAAKEKLKALFALIDEAMESDPNTPWTAATEEKGIPEGVYNKYKKQFEDSISEVIGNLVALAEQNKPTEKSGDPEEKLVRSKLQGQSDSSLRDWLKEVNAKPTINGLIEWYALGDVNNAGVVTDLVELIVKGAKTAQTQETLETLPIEVLIHYFNKTAAKGHEISTGKSKEILKELVTLDQIKETALPAAFQTYQMIMHDLAHTPNGKKLIIVFHSLEVSSGLSGLTFQQDGNQGRETTRIYINIRQIMEKIKGRTDGTMITMLKLATGTIIHEIAHAYGHDPETGNHKTAFSGVSTPGGHADIENQFLPNFKRRWFVDPDIIAAMWLWHIDTGKELLKNQ